MQYRNFLHFAIALFFVGISACSPKNGADTESFTTDNPNAGIKLPAGLAEVDMDIQDINCYSDNGKYVVTGMATNNSMKWQRVILKVFFLDENKNRIKISGKEEIYIPVSSGVIPPQGRSGFVWHIDVTALEISPTQCDVKPMGAIVGTERLQLTTMENSKVEIQSGNPENPTAPPATIGCQVSCKVYNPFDKPVVNPKAQVIIYGKDQKIWYNVVVPIDSTDQFFHAERSGPIQPKESRYIGGGIRYASLPAGLQEVGVGIVEILPFEDVEN